MWIDIIKEIPNKFLIKKKKDMYHFSANLCS